MAHHPAHGAITLPIRGMTCRSCELLLEESLGAVPGVKHVRVRRTRSCATIVIGDQPVDEAALERAVEEAGYSVGHEHVPWFSRDVAAYFHVVLGVAILGIVALGLALGGFSLPSFGTSSTSMTFSVALIVGLTAGFSTCMALIGGLVLAVSARFSKDNHHLTRWQKFQPHLAFNIGRVVGFGVLGGLLGALGSVLQLSDRVIAMLTLVVGLVMLLIGIKITEISPRIARFTPTLPRFLQWKRGDALRSSPPLVGAVTSGALTFFLPCGFTLAMQLAAMNSGSFGAGALIMAAFALGTAPGLLGIGGLTSVVHGRFAKVFFATAGVLVIGLGIFNLRTGYAALFPPQATAGIVLGTEPPDAAATTETITMSQDADGYTPNALTVHVGSHVRWVITGKNAYTCSSGIRVPSLGISKQLVAGENVIEFIPAKEGDIPFNCSMGMYRGTIKVLPRQSAAAPLVAETAPVKPAAPSPSKDTAAATETIAMTQSGSGYSPNELTVHAGSRVRWVITSTDAYTCASGIRVPSLGISKQLAAGENVLEFVPTQEGDIPFSCSMGMYRGTIKVLPRTT